MEASDGGSEGALSLAAAASSSSHESGRGAGFDLEEVGMGFRGAGDRLSLFMEESRPGGGGVNWLMTVG